MAEPLKVLSVHNFYQIRGGEDTVFANEKALLEQHGHEVLTYTRHNSEITSFPLWRKLLLPLSSVFSLGTYRKVKRLIREHGVDVVHVHNTLPLISPSVYYAAFACKVPVVQTVHNYRLQCPEGNFFRQGRICEDCAHKGLSCALKHRCYRGSFVQTLVSVLTMKVHRWLGLYRRLHYICMTTFTRDNLIAANERAGRMIFDPAKVHLKPHFTYPCPVEHREPEYYLYIGRVERIKGISLLLDAFEAMPGKRLLIAGTGAAYEDYVAEAERRGLSQVEFLGFCGRDRLRELLSRAKAVIVTSQYYEPFGMIIVEAFAAGVPVLAGDIGGFSSLVQDGENGLLYPYDSPEALCGAVKRLEADRETPWSRNAEEAYQRFYSPDANYARLTEIYRAAGARRGLKVLISLTDQSFRATKSVGIYNVSVGLARGLAQCEDVRELHILANEENAALFADMPQHVHVHFAEKPVPKRYARVWWDQVGVSRAVRAIQPDWALLPKGVPPFFPRMGKTKLACYVHDVNWEYYAKLGKGTPNSLPHSQHLYFKRLLLRALRISDLVLTSTRFNERRYLSYEPKAQVSVVGIGFDTPAEPLRSVRGRDILFYSSPYPHKLTELGVQRVAAWLAQRSGCEDIRVHVIGGLRPQFAFPDERWIPYGRLPEREMKRIMREECRVAVYFSAYEGYGMPPVECLRGGVPCVASDLPPIRENIPASLLFDNEEESSFIRAMNAAYEMTSLTECPTYPSWAEVAQRAADAMNKH